MENYVEIIGYSASAFIMGSFLIFNNIKLLRIINGIGCLLFVVYGYFIDSWPIIIPNVFIFLVQIYYLFIHKDKS
ncbi:uroporphyrinogen decarboxylase [Weeksellaceae bacterium KMM 9713]|uniref:Uroporphyrinogen decarboxylase n=1 Tax=Profundicola chukchiensis TaxID=2961959 RepID=A0A9X4RXP9_9FLAO|nr:uroporphyrinogen decarboxylase [Profundicola chukchiensis]MDG4946889.1 uroporphyrinogen decarboxylase [Profundicola chukchiensis]MDG4951297.1 uroporphyrinogen decarboxylase [Profundicola chukchiensis]